MVFFLIILEVNGDGRFQPILKSCALEEVPPNLILSFRNRIITVNIHVCMCKNKLKKKSLFER